MATAIDHERPQQPNLPGYALTSRLGAGGYGEVWLAQAPGGLTKAVKFIYGSFQERRAEHELRALQRIKDLRHPFLLSLERIEVADDRLAIVTELAESSLKDRFDQCRREGRPGIPRDELLRYLADAADALDFLSEKHRLQHLDVKPENLLLIAGHVKVADFGLVKDIGRTQASLIGGLTPLYSAPEVFEGHPSAASDQYSLAVLYQEMLTGVLPFLGGTAAELTLQHLHEEPSLAPLPTADRYVIARALAKEPQQRFKSCGDMVAALRDAPATEATWNETSAAAVACETPLERPGPTRPSYITEFFDCESTTSRPEVSTSLLLDWQPPAASEPRCLPPPPTSDAPFSPPPVVFIGIGGCGAAVLRRLRRRIARAFGDEPVAAVQMLLLDSDPKAIAQALQGDSRSALRPEETLALPLRRPQEYRDQSSRLMQWLSRRWLYNIPKSLNTEGLRPLGRLALADHLRQAVQRLRTSIAQATSGEALAASAEQTGLPFCRGAARAYVVASISGGAGSGMSLDVGHALRAALQKAGVQQAEVIGVFLQSPGRDARQCDLARVNAYAWLTEYNQFHRPGHATPGDESCGLPPLPVGARAFDHAYLIDLTADPEVAEKGAAIDNVAEYLYLDALTPAQQFFDQCRHDDEFGAASAPLRTFALRKVGVASDEAVQAAAVMLGQQVLMHWAGGPRTPAPARPGGASLRDTDQLVQGVATLVGRLQLKLEGIASNARLLIEAQFGGPAAPFLDELLEASQQGGRSAPPCDAAQLIDALFQSPASRREGFHVLQRPLEAIVSPLSMKLAGDLSRWVLEKLDDRQERLPGAQRAVQWLIDYLTGVEADAARLMESLGRQVVASELPREPSSARRSTAARQQLTAYFRLRVDQCSVAAASVIVRGLLAELKSASAMLSEFGRHLRHVAASVPAPSTPPASAAPLWQALLAASSTLIEAIDEQVQQQFIMQHGGLFQTIMGSARLRSELLALLHRLARRAAETFAARPEVLQAALATGALPLEGEFPLPPLLRWGGDYRGLAIVPPPEDGGRDSAEAVRDRFRGPPTVLLGADELALCYEGWNLPLQPIAVDVIQQRRDYADFAARAATRIDVAWTPLVSPHAVTQASAASTGGPAAAPSAGLTRVL